MFEIVVLARENVNRCNERLYRFEQTYLEEQLH